MISHHMFVVRRAINEGIHSILFTPVGTQLINNAKRKAEMKYHVSVQTSTHI